MTHSISHRLPAKSAATNVALARAAKKLSRGARKFVAGERQVSNKAKLRAAAGKAGRK